MLAVTGMFKDKMVRDELVTADEVIEYLELPIPENKTRIRFELNTASNTVMTKNKADGKSRYANSHAVECHVRGFFKGQAIDIRYYENKLDKGLGNPAVYSPKYLEIQGKSISVDLVREKEKAVVFTLFPWCMDSPIRDPQRHPKIYRVVDPEAVAAGLMQNELNRYQGTKPIFDMEPEHAMIVAAGLRIKGNSIPYGRCVTGDMAKIALLEMYQAFPNEVSRALGSKSTRVMGTMTKSFNEGKIIVSQDGQGKLWTYSTELGGREILRLLPGASDMDSLYEFLQDQAKWDSFKKKLAVEDVPDTVDIQGVSEEVSLKLKAIEEARVFRNPQDKKVYLIGQNEQISGKALFIPKTDDWRKEFLAYENKVITNRIKAAYKTEE